MKKISAAVLCLMIGCAALTASAAGNDISAPVFTDEFVSLASSDEIKINHDNSISDIVAMERRCPSCALTGGAQTRYKETPSFTAPYKAGSLSDEDIADAQNALRMVRFLAGVPYEQSVFEPELNDIAQHGAVLLAASNQFDHYPQQPNDMSDEFFETAYKGCNEANISAGRDNISECVLGWVYDAGANNIERAGHRRWIFKPSNQDFGIGYARGPASSSYRGYRANMHVFGLKHSYGSNFDSYVAWPAAGDFPIQYMAASEELNQIIDCPWSINLGSPYTAPDKQNVTLKLKRERDGKVWTFDKNTPNLGEEGLSDSKMHLAVDNDGYGIDKAIIFRPDLNSLGTIEDGDVFNVELSGIKYTDGSDAVLKYEIRFFDIQKERGRSSVTIKTTHNGKPLEGACVEIGGKTALTDSTGSARLRVNNNGKYTYTISKNGFNTETGTITVAENDVEKTVEAVKTFIVETGGLTDSLTFDAEISNNAREEKNIKVFTAFYNDENTPFKVTVNDADIPSGKSVVISAVIPKEDYNSAKSVRLFIWNGAEPLCDKQILK